MELQKTHPNGIPQLTAITKQDPEIVKWLPNYCDSERWAKSLNTHRQTLTIHENNTIIGFVDLAFKATYEIVAMDYCIFKPYRGTGQAVPLIKELHAWLKSNTPTRSILAYVNPENIPSMKTFRKAGYLDQGEVAWGLTLFTFYIT